MPNASTVKPSLLQSHTQIFFLKTAVSVLGVLPPYHYPTRTRAMGKALDFCCLRKPQSLRGKIHLCPRKYPSDSQFVMSALLILITNIVWWVKNQTSYNLQHLSCDRKRYWFFSILPPLGVSTWRQVATQGMRTYSSILTSLSGSPVCVCCESVWVQSYWMGRLCLFLLSICVSVGFVSPLSLHVVFGLYQSIASTGLQLYTKTNQRFFFI